MQRAGRFRHVVDVDRPAGHVLCRRIVQPLSELTGVARALSEGRTDVRIAHRSQDEIGVLASTFRGLVDYLGSDVCLRPADPADEVEFVAEGALPGTGVVVRREHDLRFVPFDASGRARVRLPRVPCPIRPASSSGLIDLEWYVRSSPPGFTSGPIVARQRHVLPRAEAPSQRVSRWDAGAPGNARALVRAVAANDWVRR